MAWQVPKTDWAAADGVRDTDMNRIEENILKNSGFDTQCHAKHDKGQNQVNNHHTAFTEIDGDAVECF